MATKLGPTNDGIEKQMNVLRADGWELVRISGVYWAGYGPSALVADFKRSK